MWDEYDPLAFDLLAARPEDEPLAEAMRAVIREVLGGLYSHDPERLLARIRLAFTVPELRARFLDEQTHGIEALASLLAAKRGPRVEALTLRVIGTALLAGPVFVALDLWQQGGGKRDLLALLDRATDALAEGMRELQLSRQGSAVSGEARAPKS
jgi:MftR C-terminal domain